MHHRPLFRTTVPGLVVAAMALGVTACTGAADAPPVADDRAGQDAATDEPDGGVHRSTERVRETVLGHRFDPCDRLVVDRRDEEQKSQIRVVLAGQRLERRIEPVAGFVNDDDGHDGRCVLSLRFHDVARLALRSLRDGSLARRCRESPGACPRALTHRRGPGAQSLLVAC